jgi:peptidoglycan/xylan/chitin deacetylase (PgdA/CDA1 family)
VLTRVRSVSWASGRRAPDADGFRTLFYHRVSDDRDVLAVRRAAFQRQMDLLGRESFTVLELGTAWDLLQRGALPPKTVVLNFDDGYLDFMEHAFPVLAEHGFPATVFVCPGLVDGHATMSWYERPPPLLSWPDIIRLACEGVRFEAHSMTHPNLRSLDVDTARREITASKAELERRLGVETQVFCYPAGLGGARERAFVEDAGFRLAVSCEPGLNSAITDPLWLRRIEVRGTDNTLDFRAKALGAHDRPLFGRGLYRRVRYARAGSRL